MVVPRNLPVLQLVGQYRYDRNAKVHTSTSSFLRAFEEELQTYLLDPEVEYERLLPRCLNTSQKKFLDHRAAELAKEGGKPDWSTVKAWLIEKYDTPVQKFKAW